MACSVDKIIQSAKEHLGIVELSKEHQRIIDTYNNHRPLARNYKVKYTDAWCAAFISYLAIINDATDIIPTECGCQEMIKKCKSKNIKSPDYLQPGDIVFYDWQSDGHSDHVGICVEVSPDIKIIEGNYNDRVKTRVINLSNNKITYIVRPNYIKYNIGWNKDNKGWWYSPDGIKYYKDGYYDCPWSKGNDTFYFDKEGYCIITDKDGVVQ